MDIIEITNENFDEKVLKSDKPVMLDFWATWCGPCRMQAPIFEKFAEENGDIAVFGKVNVDDQADLAMQFQVMSIPTIIVIKDASLVSKAVGVQTLEQLQDALSA